MTATLVVIMVALIAAALLWARARVAEIRRQQPVESQHPVTRGELRRIFINYRRGDDPGFAQAIFGRLEQSFSPEQLFMDVDNIPPGENFVRAISREIEQCDVVLVLVGRNWLSAANQTEGRRIDDPGDFVRLEIEAGLEQGKGIIPVLLNGATMPEPDTLPISISTLANLQAVQVAHDRFGSDMQTLISTLDRTFLSLDSLQRGPLVDPSADPASAPAVAQARIDRSNIESLFIRLWNQFKGQNKRSHFRKFPLATFVAVCVTVAGVAVPALLMVTSQPPAPSPKPVPDSVILEKLSKETKHPALANINELAKAASNLDDFIKQAESLVRDSRDPPALPPRFHPRTKFVDSVGKTSLPRSSRIALFFQDKTQYGSLSKGLVTAHFESIAITSPADGWVLLANDYRSYGQLVVLSVEGGYNILVAGLSTLGVRSGQYVFAGQEIGDVRQPIRQQQGGEPHLVYFEFRKDGNPIDPLRWFQPYLRYQLP